jgi:hypothetical protein
MSRKNMPNIKSPQIPLSLEISETVNFTFRQHPVVVRDRVIFCLFAVMIAAAPFDFPQIYNRAEVARFFGTLSLLILATVIFIGAEKWVSWYYSCFVVTDRRIIEIKQQGLFRRSVTEWQLCDISTVEYRAQTPQESLFGVGNIVCKSQLGNFVITSVNHPAMTSRRLADAVQESGHAPRAHSSSTLATD